MSAFCDFDVFCLMLLRAGVGLCRLPRGGCLLFFSCGWFMCCLRLGEASLVYCSLGRSS